MLRHVLGLYQNHDNEESNAVTTTALTTAERRALRQSNRRRPLRRHRRDHGQPLVDMLDALGVSSAGGAAAFRPTLSTPSGARRARCCSIPTSAAAIVDQDVLARDVGLLVRIEADGDEEEDGLRRSGLIDGLGAEGARRWAPPRRR